MAMAEDTYPRTAYPLGLVISCINDCHDNILDCPLDVVTTLEQSYILKDLCARFFVAAQTPANHFTSMDLVLCSLLPKSLRVHPSSAPSQERHDIDTSGAEHILHRLPQTPVKLMCFTLDNRIPQKATDTLWDRIGRNVWSPLWIVDEARVKVEIMTTATNSSELLAHLSYVTNDIWDDFIVTNYIDTNSLVLITMIARSETPKSLELASSMFKYINILGQLVKVWEDFCNSTLHNEVGERPIYEHIRKVEGSLLGPTAVRPSSQGLNIVKAFLWTAWQRAVMLHFYLILKTRLSSDWSQPWTALLALDGVERLSELNDSGYRGVDHFRGHNTSNYLCNWALELLRRGPSSLGLDYRCLTKYFTNHFGDRPGRCLKDSDDTCEGDQPGSCQRFTAAKTLSQSAHRTSCNSKCQRVVWDESSFRNATSPRAVHVDSSHTNAKYTTASRNTLAISHVWAHGQGGRPEDGINSCLHERYCDLARSFGCESYWIDSICIPDDDELRKDAISKINLIFATSKVVLLNDDDLQSIDLEPRNIKTFETLVSILLVCDWNVRAWTMLEATRAKDAVHVLCKHDRTIRLQELLLKVYKHGAIDLAVLMLNAQHLLPSSSAETPELEDAGYILSQRHASRPGDDVVIWALLINTTVTSNAAEFWKSQKRVRTAFLVSSATRVKNRPGLSWAPATPCIITQERFVQCNAIPQHYNSKYHNYDGIGSYVASITDRGLEAIWAFKELHKEELSARSEDLLQVSRYFEGIGDSHFVPRAGTIPEYTKLYTWPDKALIHERIARLQTVSLVRLLKPVHESGSRLYHGLNDRGDVIDSIVVLCSSRDNGRTWTWDGVYQWDETDNADDWEIENMTLS